MASASIGQLKLNFLSLKVNLGNSLSVKKSWNVGCKCKWRLFWKGAGQMEMVGGEVASSAAHRRHDVVVDLVFRLGPVDLVKLLAQENNFRRRQFPPTMKNLDSVINY